MDELRVEAAPGLPEVPVQQRHLARHGAAIGPFYAVQKRYKSLFDLVFHREGRTHPNATATDVKRDCNLWGSCPACLN